MTTIDQKNYGKIEIDNSEADIVQIFMSNNKEPGCEVVQIERENIWAVIEALTAITLQP